MAHTFQKMVAKSWETKVTTILRPIAVVYNFQAYQLFRCTARHTARMR